MLTLLFASVLVSSAHAQPTVCEVLLSTTALQNADTPYDQQMRELIAALGGEVEMKLSWGEGDPVFRQLFAVGPGVLPIVPPNMLRRKPTKFTVSHDGLFYDFEIDRDFDGVVALRHDISARTTADRAGALAMYVALAAAPYVKSLELQFLPSAGEQAKLRRLPPEQCNDIEVLRAQHLRAMMFMWRYFPFPIEFVDFYDPAEVHVRYGLPDFAQYYFDRAAAERRRKTN